MSHTTSETPSCNLVPNFSPTKLYSLLLFLICGITYQSQAQLTVEYDDNSDLDQLYQDILQKSSCESPLSPEDFYALMEAYKKPASPSTSSGGFSISFSGVGFSSSPDKVEPSTSTSLRGDTVFIIVRDTIHVIGDSVHTIFRDTLFLTSNNPTPEKDSMAESQIIRDTIFLNPTDSTTEEDKSSDPENQKPTAAPLPLPETFVHQHPRRADTFYITQKDTVILFSEVPSQDEVKAAHLVLQKILQQEGLTALIQEVVKDMPSDSIRKFRKEIQENVQEMNNALKKEQAQRVVEEMEAKRLLAQMEREARKQARQDKKEAWAALSKEEKKELVKAKIALIASDVGEGLKTAGMATGAAVGLSLAAVGGVVAAGVIAIGKGIVTAVSAIWNWIDDHFFIKIDLSCAAQRKIKLNRLYLNKINKNKPTVLYKGNCPSW